MFLFIRYEDWISLGLMTIIKTGRVFASQHVVFPFLFGSRNQAKFEAVFFSCALRRRRALHLHGGTPFKNSPVSPAEFSLRIESTA